MYGQGILSLSEFSTCIILSLSLFFPLPPSLSSQNAPPPVPSSHTHDAVITRSAPQRPAPPSFKGVSQAAYGVASMSVTDKTQQYKVK